MNRVDFRTRLWHSIVCFVIAAAIVISGYFIYDTAKYPCKKYKNVSYGTQTMDIYIPKKCDNKDGAGAILFIYETGWSSGIKSAVEYTAKEFASAGYVTASMDVTHVGDGATVWNNIDEISSAISKLKEFSVEKGITLNHLALHGTSSGAHLSMLYGWGFSEKSAIDISFIVNLSGATDFHSETWTEWNYDKWYGPTLACALNGIEEFEPYKNADGKLAAENIPADILEQTINKVSPLNYLSKDSVPVICGYAPDGEDGIFPTKNKTLLYDKLHALGVKNERFEFAKSTHSLASDSKTQKQLYEKVKQYCKEYFGY